MKISFLFLGLMCGTLVRADVVVSTYVIRPNTVISSSALTIAAGESAGSYSDPLQVIGKEARVALYPGRPIGFDDVGPPALVDRNQIVPLVFKQGGLSITAEGRSLSRAAAGEVVRVMNLSSRTTVSGIVLANGSIQVSKY